MAAIRHRDTKAELVLRRALSDRRLRYRLYKPGLPGRPDIAFVAQKLVVFCDGDFWHGRKWRQRKAKSFRVRTKYWVNKIESNIARDKRNNRQLRRLGWTVLRLWETAILKDPASAAQAVEKALRDARLGRAVRLRPST